MTGHIDIYGEIGRQVTLASVREQISPKFDNYVLHIHSPGGDVFEGYAIYNALKNTGKKITAYVEGTCASITTLIAASADEIVMNLKSQWMVHNPRVTSTGGESRELRNVAGTLDKIKSQLLDSWVGRTSLSRDQLSQMYDNETWLTPEQAVELGFANRVEEVLKAVASADLKNFKHMEKNQVLSALNDLTKRVKALFVEVKNMTSTLADGTVIQVESEDGDWTDKRVTLEDGSELGDGDHKLSTGETISVAGGKIAKVTEAEVEAKQENIENDMALKDENEALKARILELESAIAAKTESETQAQAKAISFENKYNTEVKKLSADVEALKKITIGDTSTPPLGDKKIVAHVGQPQPTGLASFLKQNVIDNRK